MNELHFKLEIKRDAYEIYTSMHDLYVDYIIKVADDLYYKRASYIEDYELLKQLVTFEDQMESDKDGELDYILDYLESSERILDRREYSKVYESKDYFTLYVSALDVDEYKKIYVEFDSKIDGIYDYEKLIPTDVFKKISKLIEALNNTSDYNAIDYLDEMIAYELEI